MAKFLVRDYDPQGPGYREVEGPLARTREESYVPWSITVPERRVVYARPEEARGLPGNRGGDPKPLPGRDFKGRKAPQFPNRLLPYDTLVSQERRKVCHTMLGLIALTKPQFSRRAVMRVSAAIVRFLSRRFWLDHALTRAGKPAAASTKKLLAEKVAKYLYRTDRYVSFGRFSETETTDENVMWHQVFTALTRGLPVETMINIHDGVGRAFLPGDRTDETAKEYQKWAAKLRAEGEGEIINEKWRGRKAIRGYKPSKLPGNLPVGFTLPPGFRELQERNRGVDMYERVQPEPAPLDERGKAKAPAITSGNVYYQQLDLRNELFGAGPSGTTGTALAAAFAFGGFNPDDHPELTREYLFALIGYLVGGGMHSLHESLSILRLLGLEYNSGTLLGYDFSGSPAPSDDKGLVRGQVTDRFPLLPQTFLSSPDFRAWRDEYYDIVVLGGIHWRYNNRG